MVCVTLEGLWMIANGIVDISIFRQISQVRTCNNFQFLIYYRACELCIKKVPKEEKHLINMVHVNLEGLRIISDRIVDS